MLTLFGKYFPATPFRGWWLLTTTRSCVLCGGGWLGFTSQFSNAQWLQNMMTLTMNYNRINDSSMILFLLLSKNDKIKSFSWGRERLRKRSNISIQLACDVQAGTEVNIQQTLESWAKRKIKACFVLCFQIYL